jgi:GNAT superfamily N-acetyltransferase
VNDDQPDGDVISIGFSATCERGEIVDLQKATYGANRAVLGREPLPSLADYGEVFARAKCWVARDAGKNAGAVFLEVRDDDLLMWSVATVPSRQGVGGRLMAFAEPRARELGREIIRLYTGQLLTDRIAWYSRLGYLIEWLEEMDDRLAVHMKRTI